MRLEASKRALHQLPMTEVNLKGTLGTTLLSSKQKEGKNPPGEKKKNTRMALRVSVFTKQVWLLKIDARAP